MIILSQLSSSLTF